MRTCRRPMDIMKKTLQGSHYLTPMIPLDFLFEVLQSSPTLDCIDAEGRRNGR